MLKFFLFGFLKFYKLTIQTRKCLILTCYFILFVFVLPPFIIADAKYINIYTYNLTTGSCDLALILIFFKKDENFIRMRSINMLTK